MVDNLKFIDSWPPTEDMNKCIKNDDISEEDEEVSPKRRKIKDEKKLVHASSLLSKVILI